MTAISPRYIQIDDEGYWMSDGVRITDAKYARELFANMQILDRIPVTEHSGQRAIVEAFDEPLVARSITKTSTEGPWTALGPYEFEFQFDPTKIRVDPWDRFHGTTVGGHALPFVFGRQAQMDFFDKVDAFDDETITISGKQIPVRPLYEDRTDVDSDPFWTENYDKWKQANTPPGWDLGEPAKPLVEVLPQIKISRSRIAVLGSGSGHDAKYLADQGHFVTAFDISPEAIAKAKSLHGETAHLKFVHADAFQLPKDYWGQFDIVFEHTFFCAINPARRDDAVQVWRRLLHDDGHLLAIFFAMDRSSGPPFGSSEWEIREHLNKKFYSLYWTRWKTSIPRRLGRELIVYAKKS